MGVAFIEHCEKATSPLKIPKKVNSSINNNVLNILPIQYITPSLMEPHAQRPWFPRNAPQGANIPYQRTYSSTGRTRGPLGSGWETTDSEMDCYLLKIFSQYLHLIRKKIYEIAMVRLKN
jgi:hypothetical protein